LAFCPYLNEINIYKENTSVMHLHFHQTLFFLSPSHLDNTYDAKLSGEDEVPGVFSHVLS
jgi:hypothetical protein